MLTPPKQTTIKVVRAFTAGGKTVLPGTVATYDRAFAAELISNGKAETHVPLPEAAPETETKTDKPAKADKGGSHVK